MVHHYEDDDDLELSLSESRSIRPLRSPSEHRKPACCRTIPRTIASCCCCIIVLLLAVAGTLIAIYSIDTDFRVSVDVHQAKLIAVSAEKLLLDVSLDLVIVNPNSWEVSVSGGNIESKFESYELSENGIPEMVLPPGLTVRTPMRFKIDKRIDSDGVAEIVKKCSQVPSWTLTVNGYVKVSADWFFNLPVPVLIREHTMEIPCPVANGAENAKSDTQSAFEVFLKDHKNIVESLKKKKVSSQSKGDESKDKKDVESSPSSELERIISSSFKLSP